jgi:hypothetical protein
MNIVANFEHRASSSRGKHEGESSFALCDRLGRTRDNSQRQLPTDHDYAVPTREYQTDQSSIKPAPAAARSVLGKRQRQLQRQKQPHGFAEVDRVTPYQGNALVETSIGALLQFPDGLFGNSYPNPITSELPVIQAQPREARPTGCEQGHCSRPYSKVVSGGL